MPRKLRMLAVVTFLLCVCQLTPTAAEARPFDLDGYWGGVIVRQGAELGINVEFKTEPDGVKAVIDIPGLYIHGYKLTSVRCEPPSVRTPTTPSWFLPERTPNGIGSGPPPDGSN